MPVPSTSENFGDLLDPIFSEIFNNERDQLPDMVPTLFTMTPDSPRGDSFKYSDVGEFDDFPVFSGSVSFDEVAQGYDVTATHIEKASGFQVSRKLHDDDKWNIMTEKPRGLAAAAVRTRQNDASGVFNNAFSSGSTFYVHSEGVALCSNSHTTNATGVSTATGFDNLGTAALTSTAVVAARIQMRGYRSDRGNRFSVNPDELWYPPDIFDKAEEISLSEKRPEDATNAKNVNSGKFTLHDWEYMSDTNNWFMADSRQRSRNLFWGDRVSLEFAFAEDLDTIIAKWRAYMRYSWLWRDWRFIFGASVS